MQQDGTAAITAVEVVILREEAFDETADVDDNEGGGSSQTQQ